MAHKYFRVTIVCIISFLWPFTVHFVLIYYPKSLGKSQAPQLNMQGCKPVNATRIYFVEAFHLTLYAWCKVNKQMSVCHKCCSPPTTELSLSYVLTLTKR